jgi:hypothetical protein
MGPLAITAAMEETHKLAMRQGLGERPQSPRHACQKQPYFVPSTYDPVRGDHGDMREAFSPAQRMPPGFNSWPEWFARWTSSGGEGAAPGEGSGHE